MEIHWLLSLIWIISLLVGVYLLIRCLWIVLGLIVLLVTKLRLIVEVLSSIRIRYLLYWLLYILLSLLLINLAILRLDHHLWILLLLIRILTLTLKLLLLFLWRNLLNILSLLYHLLWLLRRNKGLILCLIRIWLVYVVLLRKIRLIVGLIYHSSLFVILNDRHLGRIELRLKCWLYHNRIDYLLSRLDLRLVNGLQYFLLFLLYNWWSLW